MYTKRASVSSYRFDHLLVFSEQKKLLSAKFSNMRNQNLKTETKKNLKDFSGKFWTMKKQLFELRKFFGIIRIVLRSNLTSFVPCDLELQKKLLSF